MRTPTFRTSQDYLTLINLDDRHKLAELIDTYHLDGYLKHTTKNPVAIIYYQRKYRWIILKDIATYNTAFINSFTVDC